MHFSLSDAYCITAYVSWISSEYLGYFSFFFCISIQLLLSSGISSFSSVQVVIVCHGCRCLSGTICYLCVFECWLIICGSIWSLWNCYHCCLFLSAELPAALQLMLREASRRCLALPRTNSNSQQMNGRIWQQQNYQKLPLLRASSLMMRLYLSATRGQQAGLRPPVKLFVLWLWCIGPYVH